MSREEIDEINKLLDLKKRLGGLGVGDYTRLAKLLEKFYSTNSFFQQ